MSIEVKIPAVGESISSGVVSVWHKKNGERVEKGDALLTLETDKVSTEITAEAAGILQALVPEGQEVKIGEVVATIDESAAAGPTTPTHDKEKRDPNVSGAQALAGDGKADSSSALSPSVRRIVEEEALDPAQIRGTGKGGRLTKGDVVEAAKNRTATPTPQQKGGGDTVSAPAKQPSAP